MESVWASEGLREHTAGLLVSLVLWMPMVLFIAYLYNYFFHKAQRPLLHFNPSSALMKHLVPRLHALHERYWPTFWLSSGHCQTMFGALADYGELMRFRRELITVTAPAGRHGGVVALDWAHETAAANTPTLLIIHGLVGGSRERYVQVMARAGVLRGWCVVVFNQRGCSNTKLVSPQSYCAAYTGDLREVARFVSQRRPKGPVVAVGFSLGANILCKYLGEEGDATPLTAGVCLAAPFDMLTSAKRLNSSCLMRAYSRRMAASLKRYLRGVGTAFEDQFPDTMLNQIQTTWEFDELITAKVFGYRDAEAYYTASNSLKTLHRVKIPLLLVNSQDDPISAPASIPRWHSNRNVLVVETKAGGHSMDWFEGTFTLRPRAWAKRVTLEFLHHVLECRGSEVLPKKEVLCKDVPPVVDSQKSEKKCKSVEEQQEEPIHTSKP